MSLCISGDLIQIQFQVNVKLQPGEGHWQPEEIDDAFKNVAKPNQTWFYIKKCITNYLQFYVNILI